MGGKKEGCKSVVRGREGGGVGGMREGGRREGG